MLRVFQVFSPPILVSFRICSRCGIFGHYNWPRLTFWYCILIQAAVPRLTELLVSHDDSRVVENVCLALSRIAEALGRSPGRLEQLFNVQLISKAVNLVCTLLSWIASMCFDSIYDAVCRQGFVDVVCFLFFLFSHCIRTLFFALLCLTSWLCLGNLRYYCIKGGFGKAMS